MGLHRELNIYPVECLVLASRVEAVLEGCRIGEV